MKYGSTESKSYQSLNGRKYTAYECSNGPNPILLISECPYISDTGTSSRGPLNILQWRHNGHDGVSIHQPLDCLLKRLFRRRSKKTSKLRLTGLCAWNSPVTGEFPAQMASNAENVSFWWRHHVGNGFPTPHDKDAVPQYEHLRKELLS